jgi:hypothetical protein
MKTKIDAAKLEALIRRHDGFTVTPQSSFVKVENPQNGATLYFSKSALVSRIDISRMQYPSGPGIVDLPEASRPTGNVLQMVDFEQEEAVILETVEALLEYMNEAPKMETKARTGGGKKSTAQGWSFKKEEKQEATPEVTQEAAAA